MNSIKEILPYFAFGLVIVGIITLTYNQAYYDGAKAICKESDILISEQGLYCGDYEQEINKNTLKPQEGYNDLQFYANK